MKHSFFNIGMFLFLFHNVSIINADESAKQAMVMQQLVENIQRNNQLIDKMQQTIVNLEKRVIEGSKKEKHKTVGDCVSVFLKNFGIIQSGAVVLIVSSVYFYFKK